MDLVKVISGFFFWRQGNWDTHSEVFKVAYWGLFILLLFYQNTSLKMDQVGHENWIQLLGVKLSDI